jgi:hypothetical protein
MSELTLFKGGVPAYLSGMEDDVTSALAGGDLGQRRLSIKGNVFREMIGSKEYRVSEDRAIGIVIIKAAATNHRTYFAGSYVEGQNASPTCWSHDQQVSAPEVPEDQRQSRKCMDCPQNVKGSGQGESRACRFKRNVAVLLEGEINKQEVYQLTLPATSIFGDGEKGKLPLEAYARHLKAHGTPIAGVITEMRFDTASPTPKLTFKPVRPITEEELADIREARNSKEADEAIKLVVNLSPKKPAAALFEDAPEEKPAPKAKAVPKVEKVVEEEEEEEPPKKVASKKPEPKSASLESLVDGWDDE